MTYTLKYKNTSLPSDDTELNSNDLETIVAYFQAIVGGKLRDLMRNSEVWEVIVYQNEEIGDGKPLQISKQVMKYHFVKR